MTNLDTRLGLGKAGARSKTLLLGAASLAFVAVTGCSHGDIQPEVKGRGPTVLSAHGEPGVVELDRNLQPIQRPIVVADVKDFQANVTDVTLQFKNAPIVVPMHRISGTQWEAELTPRQLEQMAVSGHTVHYEAVVVVRDSAGEVATSRSPVSIAVKAPDADEA